MINPRRLKGSPANIARYYTIGDYYTKGGDEHSEWGGALAADLGLSGKVDPAVFRELLAGEVAGQQLGRHRREGGIQHHPGWDFTVSAPKSVSVMALVAGDDTIQRHHDATLMVFRHHRIEFDGCCQSEAHRDEMQFLDLATVQVGLHHLD